MKIYGIKNCQSVKKALEYLKHHNKAFDFVDYKQNPPSIEQLTYWVQKCGIERVLNTKGTTYKKLGLKDQNLNQEEKIMWMSKNPTLIKRPVLESGEILYFGFSEDEYAKIL